MIKNIIFDFGGVLIDWNPKHLYKSIFETEEEMDYFLENIATYEWNAQHDAGLPVAVGTAELIAEHPEYREAIEAYYGQFEKMLGGVIEGTLEIIKELKSKGYKLYGLTNWSSETLPIAMKLYPYAFEHFEGIVVSGIEKVLKPFPEIYNILLSRYDLKPNESVFIDDNAANLNYPSSIGLATIRFSSPESLRIELAKLL